ncbi:MAG: sulfatase-like hydrolase/transferase [Alphaproteobacteria bacterium]|nr:sulfatase-like hydrolase/transferase [Alphaproteobacteria bacterium]
MHLSQLLRAPPLLALLACNPKSDPPDSEAATTDSARAEGLDLQAPGAINLVVINVDTLRADHLPMYGHERETLPRLSQRPWRVIDGVHGNSTWTAHGTASLLTGLDVLDHGVRYAVPGQRERGPVVDTLSGPTFALHLQSLGFDTALFTGNEFVSRASGLNRGFVVERLVVDDVGRSNAARLSEEALGWLDTREGSAPFFMLLQPMDMHDPYRPLASQRGTFQDPETLLFPLDMEAPYQAEYLQNLSWESDPETQQRLGEQLGAVYDEELLTLDESLAGLLDGLESRGLLSQTLVVFTADHGETLLDSENRFLGHGKAFLPEVLQLPLMLLHPALAGAPERCLSSQMDVMATALVAMGIEPLAGTSAQPLQQGCREGGVSTYLGEEGALLVASWDEDRLLVQECGSGEEAWFDLSADPYAERPRLVGELDADDPLLQLRADWLEENLSRYGDSACQ